MAITIVRANRVQLGKTGFLPNSIQGVNELCDELLAMPWRRSNAQLFIPARHCGIVDGLNVDIVRFLKCVWHLRTEIGILDLEQKDNGKLDL